MKHATQDTLIALEALLARLRAVGGLQERRPGVFYRHSRAFLHFHDDPSGIHADVRLREPDFTRMRVETGAERQRLLDAVRAALAG